MIALSFLFLTSPAPRAESGGSELELGAKSHRIYYPEWAWFADAKELSRNHLHLSLRKSGSDGVEIKRVFWPEQKILFVLQRHVSLMKCWSRSDGAREWHFFFVVGQEVYQHARFVGRVKCSSRAAALFGSFGSELECGGSGAALQFHFTVYLCQIRRSLIGKRCIALGCM